jgi:hypothetical protein
MTATELCRLALNRGPLHRTPTGHWSTGRRSFNRSTVDQLIASGEAHIVDGRIARTGPADED